MHRLLRTLSLVFLALLFAGGAALAQEAIASMRQGVPLDQNAAPPSMPSVVNSDIGDFQIEMPVGPGPDPDHLDLLLRPRDVMLTVEPEGVAMVQSRVYHGAEFTYFIQLPCGVTLQSTQPSHVDIAPGTKVNVRSARVRLAAYDDTARVSLTTGAG